jgi:hypothetical protein
MGDGVLIYFGYPEAHEEDAEGAVRAGLAVIEVVGRLTISERLNVRLPFLDTYRTMCLTPEPEVRRLLEEARELPIAA